MLAEGLTNREIGARLGLSPHTVKNYLFHIFDTLGLANSMECSALTQTQPRLAKGDASSAASQVMGTGLPVEDAAGCRRAAERGGYGAQLSLAEMHWNGLGVEQDSLAAYMWYLVAEMNHLQMRPHIQSAMRRIVETLSTDEVLEAKRRASEQFVRMGEQAGKSAARA